MVQGLKNVKLSKIEFYETYIKSKMTRLRFNTKSDAKRLLEITHTDVVGPITPLSHESEKYFVTFIDGVSGFCIVYIIKSKDKVLQCFTEHMNPV